VTADAVYGGDPALRVWLEDRGVSYVLAVKGTEPLVPATRRSARATAIQLATSVPAEQWVACSAGHGAKGRRLYDWARIQLATPAAGGCARWLLVRRRRDGELAFYVCCGPANTSLVGLVRVAGTRWAIEEGFQQAKPRSAWTTTRFAVGRAGTGTSPWPCWPMPSWSSPAPRPPVAAQRGMRPPDQPTRPPPADRARGPPAAGRPGVDDTYPAWLGAGLVTLAPPPPDPRPPGTLSTTRTASGAGVLA
jgi:hypothetical protein